MLFCDRALAVQVPYESDASPIASHTISTAQSAGWIWDIGLPTRRGVGYVYSSRHISDDDAERELRAYIGPAGKDLPARKIPIRSGHRETFWKRNCVAVGLAAGFLEPLEASAIVLIELSAKLIAEQMPACREVMDIIARALQCDDALPLGPHHRFPEAALRAHEARRTARSGATTCLPETIPERLQDLLLLWSHQSPWFHDEFDRVEEVFPGGQLSVCALRHGLPHRRSSLTSLGGDAKQRRARAARERRTDRTAAGGPAAASRSASARSSSTACSRSEGIAVPNIELLDSAGAWTPASAPGATATPHFVQIAAPRVRGRGRVLPDPVHEGRRDRRFYAGAMFGFKPGENLLQ